MAPYVAIFPSRFKWRNANMAETSGPLSSASTSTQSPASSSSGNSGSTSQPSGTLVVHLFISTYSSFGGPLVVSTLTATSSANLPLVVGGSCGGATGSESSAFPNLNKAFVIGPGFAPVRFKFVSKITASRAFFRLGCPTSRQYPSSRNRAPSVFGGKTCGIRV